MCTPANYRSLPWLSDTHPDTVAVGEGGVPSRFKRVLDKATGKHYYYDKETKETVRSKFARNCTTSSNSPHLPHPAVEKNDHGMYS